MTTDELLLIQRAAIKRYKKQEMAMKKANKGKGNSGAAFGKPKSLEGSLKKFEGRGQLVDK